jgi:hypothetical protein
MSDKSQLSEAAASSDADSGGGPSLATAWRFMWSVGMPRRLEDPPGSAQFRQNRRGERGGALYPLLGPTSDLADFGLGVALYFYTLLALGGACLLAFAVQAPSFAYFYSNDYSAGQPGVEWTLRGSAACTNVACVVLNTSAAAAGPPFFPVAGLAASACAVDPQTQLPLAAPADVAPGTTHAITRDCALSWVTGATDIGAFCVLMLAIALFRRFQGALTRSLDESVQTCQDYAVMVHDPDSGAVDPDEWRAFFEQFGPVASVTVALNNGSLLRQLSAARLAKQRLAEHEGDDAEAELQAEADAADKAVRNTVANVNSGYSAFKVARVFVVFEAEAAQRKCLSQLSAGVLVAHFDWTCACCPDQVRERRLFRGTNRLRVSEAVEPSEVIWHNLGVHVQQRIGQQLLSLALAVALCFGAFYLIRALQRELGPEAAAIGVSLLNAALPTVLKLFSTLEQHVDFGNQNQSMLRKLLLARFFNSAFIIYLLTPFGETLSAASLRQIQAILIADAFTTPVFRLLNLPTRLAQAVLAPRAKSQAAMNAYFNGTAWWLAERYTDVTKTFFVSMFYSALLPSGLLITAVSCFTCFAVDKFCLLRQWKVAPKVDGSLAVQSRGHLLFCVLVKLAMALRFYYSWPFDGWCAAGGDHAAGGFAPCDKHPPRRFDGLFQPGDAPWMRSTQSDFVLLFQHLVTVTASVMLLFYAGPGLLSFLRRLFIGHASNTSTANDTPFSEVPAILMYVPQVDLDGGLGKLQDPLVAADVSRFDATRHVDWVPSTSTASSGRQDGDELAEAYRKCCLVSDADVPGIEADATLRKKLFSTCVGYAAGVGAAPAEAVSQALVDGGVVQGAAL